jgi:hypothetical protein
MRVERHFAGITFKGVRGARERNEVSQASIPWVRCFFNRR